MKKLVLVSLFVLAGFGLVFGATTGTLAVQGVVASILSVEVTSVTGYNALDLATTTTGTTVGSAKIISNNKSYKVAVHSANGSKLKSADTEITEFVAYTFKLDGITGLTTAVTLPSSLPTPQGSMTGKTAVAGDSFDMILIYTGVASLTATTYTDTITITVSAP